jgi:hypothetical protein
MHQYLATVATPFLFAVAFSLVAHGIPARRPRPDGFTGSASFDFALPPFRPLEFFKLLTSHWLPYFMTRQRFKNS